MLNEDLLSDAQSLIQRIRDEAETAREEHNEQLADVFDTIADNFEAALNQGQ